MKQTEFQRVLSDIVDSWDIKWIPEYRKFNCGKCLKKINKEWHIWLMKDGFRSEVHLCNKCYNKLQTIHFYGEEKENEKEKVDI